jgi:NTE family protein
VRTTTRPKTALVLSGGGARGAYQAGVLRGLVEHGFIGGDGARFDTLVGSSAGAINAAGLASRADDPAAAVARIDELWRDIRAAQVYRTDVTALGTTGFRWAWDLTFGGVTRRSQPKSLLDTTPLRAFLRQHMPFDRIAANIAGGYLDTLAVIATDLHTSNGVVFVHTAEDTPTWGRRRWRVERDAIGVVHLMASSAIPIFFPPIEIGGCWFGDGSIRNTAPLSPAIHLGADRIVAIGVSGPPPARATRSRPPAPTVAEIAGVLLDAVMLDALEVDVEHAERVNMSVLHCPTGDAAQPFRRVEVLWLRPSERIRELAAEHAHRIPRLVRYLMRGLGPDPAITELTSYLLFDPGFCGQLLELGRSDVAAERDRIKGFFALAPTETIPRRVR